MTRDSPVFVSFVPFVVFVFAVGPFVVTAGNDPIMLCD
jgi:hypothetical protein